MKLRTGTSLATLRALSHITGFGAGRHFRLSYAVDLVPEDLAADVTLTSAVLVIAAAFGASPPLVTKTIGLTPNPSVGQITDDAEDDGAGALHFQLQPEDTAQLSAACAFEVIVVDSLGRETTLDAGAIVASVGVVGPVTDPDTDVGTVEVTPARAAVIVTHGLALTAQVLDDAGAPLLGREITWATTNAAVATVDEDGLVTPVGTGSCFITATVDGVSGVCALTSERLTLGTAVRIGGVIP